MTCEEVFVQLFRRGIRLSMVDDQVKVNAPPGAVTQKDLTTMQHFKSEFPDVIDQFEERAGYYEFDAGKTRAESERFSIDDLVTLIQKRGAE